MKISGEFRKYFDFEQILIKSRREKVLASLEKYPHSSILEIGCGMVSIIPFCEEYDEYTVVDPSQTAKKNIKQYTSKQSNITFVPNYFENVYKSLKNSKEFDFVILSSVLHEVPDPNKFLCALHHVCQENTVAHINVPNMFSFHRLLALEMGIINSLFEKSKIDKKFRRSSNFDKEALYGMLKENGFQVISFGTYFVKLFTNEQMDNLFKRGIVDKSLLVGLENMIKYMPEWGCEMYVEVKKRDFEETD